MGVQHPHTKIIIATARETLEPLGLIQKGRSRSWYDDHGWWLCNVSFGPSAFTRGTYLNVGVQFLWDVVDDGVFHFGSEISGVTFLEYESDEQFAPGVRAMAAAAVEEVRFYRGLFPTVEAAARALNDVERWTGLEHRDRTPDVMDRAIATGLTGDMTTARKLLGECTEEYERDVAAEEWEIEDRNRAEQLLALDADAFTEQIRRDIAETRALLKLD